MQDINYQLGSTLLKKNILDFNTLQKALHIKETEDSPIRRSLAQILVKDLNFDHDAIYREVADFYGFRQIRLSGELLDEKRLKFIRRRMERAPESIRKLMEEEKILLFGYEQIPTSQLYKYIYVAIDPTNGHVPTVAMAMNAKRYEVCYINSRDFEALWEMVFPPENQYLKILEDSSIEIQEEEDEDSALQEDLLDAEINKSLLVHLVEGMLLEAVVRGASDIHIVPRDVRTTEIHFRIDGKLRLWHVQEGVRPEAMAAVVKDRSKNIDRFERDSPQDGFIQRTIGGHMIRFRVSVLPIVGKDFQYKFESIVIRVLDDRKVISDFNQLGFQGVAKEFFLKAITKPQGMVIVTGPTGSGKSTTLFAALNYVMKPEINVLTVEDPVEYIIPGARQIKIGHHNSFEQAIRSILRHDPDVVMVGEIRDKVTAETAIKLANTGHLTFSTLHTNDAPSAISRLYMMGIEPFLIAYAINVIIAQRLIRRLCEYCKTPVRKPDIEAALSLGFSEEEARQIIFYDAVGCDQCHGGYKGRVAIHEVLYFSKEIQQIIFEAGKEIDEERLRETARKQGMQTLRGAGRERIKQGLSTLAEVGQATMED